MAYSNLSQNSNKSQNYLIKEYMKLCILKSSKDPMMLEHRMVGQLENINHIYGFQYAVLISPKAKDNLWYYSILFRFRPIRISSIGFSAIKQLIL